jgi:hypothetical protein
MPVYLTRYSYKLLFLMLLTLISACGGDKKSTPSTPIKSNNKVTSISPVGKVSHGSILFSWQVIEGASQYELSIDSNKVGLKEIKISTKKANCSIPKKTCTYTPSIVFKQGDSFQWQVRSKVGSEWSDYGERKSVSVKKRVTPPANQTSAKLLAPINNEIYFGVFSDFGGTEDQVTKDKIETFDSLAQKPTAWSYFSNNWNGWENSKSVAEIKYPKANIHTIAKSGKTPFVRILPWVRVRQIGDLTEATRKSAGKNLLGICHISDNKGNINHLISQSEWGEHAGHGDWKGDCNSAFSMQNIISGKWDKELKQWAKEAKADRDEKGKIIPLLATFTIEMNGYWFPWSGIYNGGAIKNQYGDPNLADGPERYRDAYRHIIDLFRKEGVKHITWFFVPDTMDPNEDWVSFLTEGWNAQKNYYPGDDYIDWIGTNLYGAAAQDYNWTFFSDDWAKKYPAIQAITSNKPLALMEFGVIEDHSDGSKTDWFNDAFDTIQGADYPFQAISYWHDDLDSGTKGMKINSSAKSLATFRNRVKNPKYKSSLRFSQ